MELDHAPVNAEEVKRWSQTDPELSQVMQKIKQGWSQGRDRQNLKPYETRKEELSSFDGCLLWGTRVVIPQKGRTAVLEHISVILELIG